MFIVADLVSLNKANSSDTEAPFLDLGLSITNGILSTKMYDKRDDYNFEIVNFHLLMEMFIAPLTIVYTYSFCKSIMITSTTEKKTFDF